jgi:hypothetical protein
VLNNEIKKMSEAEKRELAEKLLGVEIGRKVA